MSNRAHHWTHEGLPVDILHPLCELTPRWHNYQTDPMIDTTAQPVFMDGNVYTKGTSDCKNTPWKYSTSTGCWSQLSPPQGIEIEDYVITTYQGQLIWIGGRINISEYTLNRKIFVMKNDTWTEDTDFIQPLPENVTHTCTSGILASSEGKDLIIVVISTSKLKLLVFDGHEWIERNGPDQKYTIGDVIVHDGTVYMIQPGSGHRYCYTVSMKSLLAVDQPDWKPLNFSFGHSNLTVAGGHVVMVTHASYALQILGFSTTSDSWIQLGEVECRADVHEIPSIIGTDNGKLLMMGRIRVKGQTSRTYMYTIPHDQFYICELISKVTPYDPRRKITLSSVLKLELSANIQVLTQLYTQQKLGPLMERAGFSQSHMSLPLARLYNMSPAAKCIKSWIDDKNPSLQPTWKNFLKILQEPGMNLGEPAKQIESYFATTAGLGQGSEPSAELSGMEELQELRSQIESIPQFTATTNNDKIHSMLEICSKKCCLAFNKLGREQGNFMQRIEELEKEKHQLNQDLHALSLRLENQQKQPSETTGHMASTVSMSKLTEKNLPALLKQLKKHAAKWREIGVYLEFLPGELSNIEARPHLAQGAPLSWLGAMLEEWLQWAPGDSRGSENFAYVTDLKDALSESGLGSTAHDIHI